ncbi:hypothetical protein [Mariniplasma anaerobium]|uniref:Uncharacterized protein n=1 Tax=Mariniplasma anaerobium TaxID=2735436 RepID=A0A7U9XVJ7_9MOLU|nr:hypothetical protein [Mariniplasma anaerobium]BCR35224.1 hypothetical protein MPAN_001170 [Mariniplasma anaerobium]
MKKNNSKIYFVTVIIALVIGIVLHYSVRSVGDWKAFMLYYVPLLLLFIPTLIFWLKKIEEVKTSIPLLILTSGITLGVLIIIVIAVVRFTNDNILTFGTTSYYIMIYGVSLVIFVGIVWYWIEEIDSTKKILYSLIGLAFIFFMFSSLKGFYIYDNNVYGFNGPFMRWDLFWSYMFQNLIYTLALLFFPISIYSKYRLLEE